MNRNPYSDPASAMLSIILADSGAASAEPFAAAILKRTPRRVSLPQFDDRCAAAAFLLRRCIELRHVRMMP
jgi:hypothetical protein